MCYDAQITHIIETCMIKTIITILLAGLIIFGAWYWNSQSDKTQDSVMFQPDLNPTPPALPE